MRNRSLAAALLLISVSLMAADPVKKTAKPEIGDKVQVEWAGKKVDAEVIGFSGTGWIQVKFKMNNIDLTPTLPPDKIQPLAKGSAAKAKPAANAKPRTWTDKTGKFKIEAKFVELKDDQVTLERADGRTVSMALDKLSDEDQKAAKELAKQTADEENPFEPKGKDANPFEPAKGGAANDEKPTEADWSEAEQIVVNDPGAWALKIEAAAVSSKKLSTKAIMLGKGGASKSTSGTTGKSKAKSTGSPSSFFENFDSVIFNETRTEAFAVVVDKPPGQPQTIKIHRCDLTEGKSSEPLVLPATLKPVDIDSSGELLLARTDFFFGNKGIEGPTEVSLWQLDGKEIRHRITWNPNEPGNVHKQPPSLAKFVDSDHVLTLCFPSKLTLWDATKARAIYKMELTAGTSGAIAISPGHKYLAAPVNNGLYVFDALTGQTAGKVSGDPGPITALSFRPDGKQLAALSSQRLQIWDTETGDVYRDIYFSWPIHATKIDWVADGYVLVGGENLVDLERRIVLWQYQHDGGVVTNPNYGVVGGVFWHGLTSRDRTERGLFRAVLPNDDAKKMAASLKPDQLLAVKPGAVISLRLSVSGAPADQERVSSSLKSRLKDLGMIVANDSKVTLEVSTETGQTRQIEYRKFGAFGATEKATVTEQISRLRLVEQGKTLWEAVAISGAPFLIHMKQGESLQDALAPYQKPNLGFFDTARIPQYIARPHEKGAYGATSLTPQGMQPATVRPPPKTPEGQKPGQPNQTNPNNANFRT